MANSSRKRVSPEAITTATLPGYITINMEVIEFQTAASAAPSINLLMMISYTLGYQINVPDGINVTVTT